MGEAASVGRLANALEIERDGSAPWEKVLLAHTRSPALVVSHARTHALTPRTHTPSDIQIEPQLDVRWNPNHSASPSRGNQEFRGDQRSYFDHQPSSAATVHVHQPSLSPLGHLRPTLFNVSVTSLLR